MRTGVAGLLSVIRPDEGGIPLRLEATFRACDGIEDAKLGALRALT